MLFTFADLDSGKKAETALRQSDGSERDVLGLICQGQTDLDMSESLKLSHNTIRSPASLYRKIGVNRRAAAIIWARERGITGKDAIKSRRQGRSVEQVGKY
jgi:DNA-binding CsgD family transcriptional regulator